ncbi:glycosyltransferase [Paenibacillus flagellatus]|uniref:Glycosyl transferase family 1 n=1 Tax=Paenibacillus flagellatus TaxID=2211139 RepID=A0A2V5K1E1_9BACL|nr:glycosyltransferase [Paenibacillus flagellatus]PYI52938.1 glycosyl transferase family 1 [Paenibacillus flagellatus]
MNIMVFNVPAESVGALSILNQFYDEVHERSSKTDSWFFVLGKPKLEETANIRILRFPWIKRSWFHRYYFDNIIAPKLIKKYKIDKVISFQNITIPRTKVEQILYVHNCLPFIDYKFNFRENKILWVYQNIIGKKILKSVIEANKVIVQTEWMKNACIERTGIDENKIDVVLPKINIAIKQKYVKNKKTLKTFFYPASEFIYKNHQLIVDACQLIIEQGINDFKVIFTLKGNENSYVSGLYKKVTEKRLPVQFVGALSREHVFDMYGKSILLFPSYIETFGLPLLEAKFHETIILASDCVFSREVVGSYKNAYFFDPFDSERLADVMKKVLLGKIQYKTIEREEFVEFQQEHQYLIDALI